LISVGYSIPSGSCDFFTDKFQIFIYYLRELHALAIWFELRCFGSSLRLRKLFGQPEEKLNHQWGYSRKSPQAPHSSESCEAVSRCD